jgi:cyclohexanecarboxylate-CoA ligase
VNVDDTFNAQLTMMDPARTIDRGVVRAAVAFPAKEPDGAPEGESMMSASTDMPVSSLAAAFHNAVLAFPDRTAVIDGERSLTFAQLRSQVEAYAIAMRAAGVGTGDTVSMQLPNWWETHAITIAASLVGAVLNPIVSIYRRAEVEFIVRQAGSRLLIVPEHYRGYDFAAMADGIAANAGHEIRTMLVRGGAPATTAEEPTDLDELWQNAARRAPDAVAYLLYTSGSTADPKGALHSSRTLLSESDQVARIARLGADDCVFMPSPITHVTGLAFGVLVPTLLSIPTVLMDRWEPAAAARLVEAHRCTFSVSATTFLLGLTTAYEAEKTTSSLRVFICGGSEVGPALVERAQRSMGTRVVRTYGSTELPTFCTGDPFGDLVAEASFDGTPNEGTDYWLETETGRAKVGVGEALIKGRELFLGYLDPKANADAFTEDGFFHTGDILQVDEDGRCRVVGRKKDIIIRGGENLSAIEIEDHLQQHARISDVAVVAMPDPVMGERACAFIVCTDEGDAITLEEVRDFLTGRGLAVQKTPERVELTSDLPHTASGKVQKHLLRDRIRALLVEEGAIDRPVESR